MKRLYTVAIPLLLSGCYSGEKQSALEQKAMVAWEAHKLDRFEDVDVNSIAAEAALPPYLEWSPAQQEQQNVFSSQQARNTKAPVIFRLDNDRDTVLFSPEGTKLIVPARIFQRKKDRKYAAGTIVLKVREFYRLSDQLKAHLSTVSNDALLETGGMLHLEAFEGNEPLGLAEGKELVIGFPTTEIAGGEGFFPQDLNIPVDREDAADRPVLRKRAEMRLFYGNWTAGGINWTPNETGAYRSAEPASAIVQFPDTPPEFPGGMQALRSYLSSHIIYPEAAYNAGIEGKVFLRFVISETGKVDKIDVLKTVDSELGRAAMLVIAGMPDWIPARNKGIPVATSFSIPVTFRVDGAASTETPEQRELRNRKLAAYREKLVGSDQLYFLLSSARLEWINCDRFQETAKKVNSTFDLNDYSENAVVSVVFTRRNSVLVLPLSSTDPKKRSAELPLGEPAVVVVVAEKAGKRYFAIQPFSVSEGTIRVDGFREPSDAAIAGAVDELR